jgi:mono/diheme cytochrome c family protein
MQLRLHAALTLLIALAAPGQTYAQSNAVYLGWRHFQANCARCHGADATGTDMGPNLLARVKGMSEGRFVSSVLQRYQWILPASEAGRDGAAREALLEDVLRRRKGESLMPAWENEPSVKAHILDLYAYLSGRANGAVGPGHPPQSR